jgi:hypothetical protein
MTDRERWIKNEALLKQADQNSNAPFHFEEVVKGMEARGWKPLVVETRRSRMRQIYLVARGASRTLRSKHLTGKAADIIDARWEWKLTPVEFIADLFILALQQGLTTGVLFDLPQATKDRFRLLAINEKTRSLDGSKGFGEILVQEITQKRGWDPCHVEVP